MYSSSGRRGQSRSADRSEPLAASSSALRRRGHRRAQRPCVFNALQSRHVWSLLPKPGGIVVLDTKQSSGRNRRATMLIRTMQEFESQGRIVSISHGKSTAIRLLTKADGQGFSNPEALAAIPTQGSL